jgi:hypothetical protein
MRTCLLLLIGAFTVCNLCASEAWRFVPPEGSGVVNVKDYGAKGDGTTDDTEAIRQAIADNIDRSRYRSNAFIWFPAGTYVVSGPIEGRVEVGTPQMEQNKVWSAGWRSMMLLIGESREQTVIKLQDRAPGYDDPAKPKWVLACGSEGDKRDNHQGGGNRAFRHGFLNLTVDVGSGNPGAIGIDFVASNRGTVEGVTVRAGPDSGQVGINLTRWWPGPALIQDVRIEGFARGFDLAHYQYGMTFEDIELVGQREIGIKNRQNVLAMRRVRFEGSVPFYHSTDGHNMLSLLDSTLIGTGTEDSAAIATNGILNLRRVTVQGYGQVVADSKSGKTLVAAETGKPTVVETFDHGTQLDAAGSEPTPLDLPIEEAPIIRPGPNADWVIAGETGEELQAQIDAGAEYIYVKPLKAITLTQPLILRGKLKLIFGRSGHLKVAGDNQVALRIEDGTSDTVVLEHIYIDGRVEHTSDRTFALRHGDLHGGGLHATGAGKTHIVDVIGKGYQVGPDHRFWARQLNAEFGSQPLFTNRGTTWILGFKMESSTAGSKDAPLSTPSIVNESGSLELFAGLLYTLGNKKQHAPKVPAFTNEQGQVAISYRTNGQPDTYYRQILRMGSFESGEDLTADRIKGHGAALLSDRR